MNPGDTILARLQQSDGAIKKRPALVIAHMPPYNDLLICGISSRLHQQVEGFDEVISQQDSDFPLSGLKVASLFRLGMITTIPKSAAIGDIGSISHERLYRLRRNLAEYLSNSQKSDAA